MKLTCHHCGRPFRITADQLGRRGHCPSCREPIDLPAATDAPQTSPPRRRSVAHFLHNSIAGLASIVIHMAILLVLALVNYDRNRGDGLGEEVLIGTLPTDQLSQFEEPELSGSGSAEKTMSDWDDALEVQPPVMSAESPDQFAVQPPTATGNDSGQFDLGSVSIGGGSMGSGSWDGMLQTLRRNGLDIVITFDSTGSMAGEISEVKQQIHRIGTTLAKLVPKVRISLCTYRDQSDEYVVRGLPLTDDISDIQYYLSGIVANGGGDFPEAVYEGLQWAITHNEFRPQARKVILIFGDAPPHQSDYRQCLRLASDFNSRQGGVVSTVTCRAARKMSHFDEIAEVGGGESFLTADERQIITQLMILVFGSRYREKVVETFGD